MNQRTLGLLVDLGLYGPVYRARHHLELRRWQEHGRHGPAPAVHKINVIRRYQCDFGLRTFVETGTHMGTTLAAVDRSFATLISIEIDDALYRRAQQVFARRSKVKLLHGDSADLLPGVIAGIHEPALFWLDAHFDVAGAGMNLATPLRSEVALILQHNVAGHVILIDDARGMGVGEYPSLQEISALAEHHWPRSSVEVADDIIRITAGGQTQVTAD